VQDPLALKILDGEVLHGDHVMVDADKKAGKMTFKVSGRVGEKVTGQRNKCVVWGRATSGACPERSRRSGRAQFGGCQPDARVFVLPFCLIFSPRNCPARNSIPSFPEAFVKRHSSR